MFTVKMNTLMYESCLTSVWILQMKQCTFEIKWIDYIVIGGIIAVAIYFAVKSNKKEDQITLSCSQMNRESETANINGQSSAWFSWAWGNCNLCRVTRDAVGISKGHRFISFKICWVLHLAVNNREKKTCSQSVHSIVYFRPEELNVLLHVWLIKCCV